MYSNVLVGSHHGYSGANCWARVPSVCASLEIDLVHGGGVCVCKAWFFHPPQPPFLEPVWSIVIRLPICWLLAVDTGARVRNLAASVSRRGLGARPGVSCPF